MKYLVRKSIVQIIGTIWMPAATCAQTLELSTRDVDNCRDDSGHLTRESVEQWLTTHTGDFQHVADFYASIEDGENTVEIPWQSEDSEVMFNDCMFPDCEMA